MKTKCATILAVGSLAFGALSVAQTTQMTGKVVAVTAEKITVQQGTAVWNINLTASTQVTGEKKVGSVVTVSYNAPDAQKKESPTTNGTPTPAAE